MNREITTHKVNSANDTLTIVAIDEPGAGGANHHYLVMLPSHVEQWRTDQATYGDAEQPVANLCSIRFQNGPIPSNGVNGVTQEVLLAIVQDRLESFQAGKFPSEENSKALAAVKEAQHWLQFRTLKRMARGVEGTHQK